MGKSNCEVRVVDVMALFGAINNAYAESKKTGEEKIVRLSDYSKPIED